MLLWFLFDDEIVRDFIFVIFKFPVLLAPIWMEILVVSKFIFNQILIHFFYFQESCGNLESYGSICGDGNSIYSTCGSCTNGFGCQNNICEWVLQNLFSIVHWTLSNYFLVVIHLAFGMANGVLPVRLDIITMEILVVNFISQTLYNILLNF